MAAVKTICDDDEVILSEDQIKPVPIAEAFDLASQHLQAGRLIEAEVLCHQMLAAEPNHPDVLHMLGVIAYEAGMYEVAAELFGGVIGIAQNFAQAHFNLGNTLKKLGMRDEAIICYQNTVLLNSGYAEAYYNLGSLFQDQGKLTESLDCYNKAIATDSGHADAFSRLLEVLKKLGIQLEPLPADLVHKTLDSFVDYFIRNPFVSTAPLVEAFSGLFASWPGRESDGSSVRFGNIHDKNRIDLFKVECSVEALGRERFLAKVGKQVDISTLESSAFCKVTRLDGLSSGFVYFDSLSCKQSKVPSLSGKQAVIRQHSVVALSDARLCIGYQGFAVFDADDHFVNDVCWGDGVLFALADRAKLPPVQTFDGTVMPLCGVWGSEYFHWVLEMLPRLLLVLQAGYRLEDVDLFLVDRKLPHLMEFLEVLGIRLERVAEWRSMPHLKASKLLFTSSPVNYDFGRPLPSILIEPWISQGLHRAYALTCDGKTKRRIYIDRENARYRKVANNAAVKALLERYGFESHCLESLSLQEKRALFSCAEMVVGPAGAGFSNLMLCNEGAKALILYQEDFATDSFWSICNNNGLVHFHLLCKAADAHGLPKFSPAELNDDLLVDVDELERSVNLMVDYIPQLAHLAGATA